MADLKSQAVDQASGPRVAFASPAQQLPHQQQPQYQQQLQQQLYGPQPALMWENAQSADCRQSGGWPPAQMTPGNPAEAATAAAVQLPHLLQKLQRTQEKLESRDASARKYKVGCIYRV